MKIILAVFQLKKLGGKERDCLAIARHLADRGHDIEIVTTSPEVTAAHNYPVTSLTIPGFTNYARARAFAEAAVAYRNRTGSAVLLAFERIPDADFFYAADNPTPRGWTWTPRYRTRMALETGVFAESSNTHIFFLTSHQRDAYAAIHRFSPCRCTVLPLILHDDRYEQEVGADRDSIREELRLPIDALLALSIATNPRLKGLDRVLNALPLHPRLHLMIIGSQEPWLLRRIRSLGVEDRVHTRRYIPNIMGIISAADFLVHPARAEAAGQVIGEALLAGVPVIVSEVCGYADRVGDAGIVLREPFEGRQVADAITTMVSRLPALRAAARAKSLELRKHRGEWLSVIADKVEKQH